MRTAVATLTLAFTALGSSPGTAQGGPESDSAACTAAAAGTSVRGTVFNDSTLQPIAHRAVYLQATNCVTATDSMGRFEIHGIAPGRYEISVGALGYRTFDPIPIDVGSGAVVTIDLYLRPGNLVADCIDVARCRSFLTPESALLSGFTEAERLEEAAWRTIIALAGKSWETEWVTCVVLPDSRLLRVLEQRFPFLVHSSDCELAGSALTERRLVHTPSSMPARRVLLTSIKEVADGAWVGGGFYVGPLWAEGWSCWFVQRDGAWAAEWCRLDWIS